MRHGDPKNLTCPICLKAFDAAYKVKAHQQRKRHLTHKMVEEPWAKYQEIYA